MYESEFDRRGNTVAFGLECIFVEDDPVNLTGNEILLHLNATGLIRRVGTHWRFESVRA